MSTVTRSPRPPAATPTPTHPPAPATAIGAGQAAQALIGARERVRWLLGSCTQGDLVTQHSPLMSPLVWDLAHIGVQEELWLRRVRSGVPSVLSNDVLDLYDAFRHPRADRVDLPLLDPTAAWELCERIRGLVLAELPDDDADDFLWGMVAQHEQQHAETMTATLALRRGRTPIVTGTSAVTGGRGGQDSRDRCHIPGGPCLIGTTSEDEPWSLDNERGQHEVDVAGLWMERLPVSNARWLEFMADGGYRREQLWTRTGWAHRCDEDLAAPLHWQPHGDTWQVHRFGVLEPVDLLEPVQHVCQHEAQAFARWCGGRLPSEVEWEKACAWDPVAGRRRRWPWGDTAPDATLATLGGRTLRPARVGSLPGSASAYGVEQLIGDVWEWTDSPLSLWPGFTPMVYADYTLPFAGDDTYRVLRGGSWAVDQVAVRPSFRNWDLPVRRQIFTGVRVVFDDPGPAS